MKFLKDSKGFTLAELLIVMAIVVVLASVAIPSFTRQLETSRETADLETLRNAYTDAYAVALADVSDDGILFSEGTAVTKGNVVISKAATDANKGKEATYTVTGLTFVQATAGFDYVTGSVGGVALTDVTGATTSGTSANKLGTTDKVVKFVFEITSGDSADGSLSLKSITGAATA